MIRVEDLVGKPQPPLGCCPINQRAAISGRHTLTSRTSRKSLKTLTGGIYRSTQIDLATRPDLGPIS